MNQDFFRSLVASRVAAPSAPSSSASSGSAHVAATIPSGGDDSTGGKAKKRPFGGGKKPAHHKKCVMNLSLVLPFICIWLQSPVFLNVLQSARGGGLQLIKTPLPSLVRLRISQSQ